MAQYKLRKLHPDGTPFTDEEMRSVVLTVPSTPIVPPKPKKPAPKLPNEDYEAYAAKVLQWHIDFWRPYQAALDEREMIVNQFASWLAAEFYLMQIRPRGEYRIKSFMGGYVMFARNLTGYWKAKPTDPIEYIISNTIST